MSKIIVTRLAELRTGDVLLAASGKKRSQPLEVAAPLGPIEDGSPVIGVRFQRPNERSVIEWVFYPAQMDGQQMEIERPGA
jgi:hypothetical protein